MESPLCNQKTISGVPSRSKFQSSGANVLSNGVFEMELKPYYSYIVDNFPS